VGEGGGVGDVCGGGCLWSVEVGWGAGA